MGALAGWETCRSHRAAQVAVSVDVPFGLVLGHLRWLRARPCSLCRKKLRSLSMPFHLRLGAVHQRLVCLEPSYERYLECIET